MMIHLMVRKLEVDMAQMHITQNPIVIDSSMSHNSFMLYRIGTTVHDLVKP